MSPLHRVIYNCLEVTIAAAVGSHRGIEQQRISFPNGLRAVSREPLSGSFGRSSLYSPHSIIRSIQSKVADMSGTS